MLRVFAVSRMIACVTAGLQDRIPVLIQKYQKKTPWLTERAILDVHQYDPTGDKASYTDWLVRNIEEIHSSHGVSPRFSVLANLKRCLEFFDKTKSSNMGRVLKLDPDIYKYNVTGFVESMVEAIGKAEEINKEKDTSKQIRSGQSQAELVYRDGERTIWKVKGGKLNEEELSASVDTLCKLTHQGGWCVKDPTWGLRYLKKGSVFLIMEGEKRFALYSPSTRQFRDPSNREIKESDNSFGWAKKLWRAYQPPRPNTRRKTQKSDRDIEFEEYMEQNVRKQSIVTRPRGSWKWQNAYNVAEYYPAMSRRGDWVWKFHRYLFNKKVSMPQLNRSGYGHLPQGGYNNTIIPNDEVQSYKEKFDTEHPPAPPLNPRAASLRFVTHYI